MEKFKTHHQMAGVIGRLDRCLSEVLLLAAEDLDEADRQTLKHHADDLVGVAAKIYRLLDGPLTVPDDDRV